MTSKTLLAVPITEHEPPLPEQVRAARRAGADLVELRVDRIGDAAAAVELLARDRAVPFILTIRSAEEGGGWKAGEAERIALYEQLGLLLPGFVDVELVAWSRSADLRQKISLIAGGSSPAPAGRPRNRLILSHHDLRGTPADLDQLVRSLLECPADVIKLVFTPRDATDAWRVLSLLRRYGQRRSLIALALGEAGLLTRVLAGKFGGFLTFAALEAGAGSAPGQPTVRELLETYRWRKLGPASRVYGVVGWPVTQSRSPQVHNAAMGAAGIDGVYVPMPIAPTYADFAALMDLLTAEPELDVAGLSVTIPHKQHALRWLDERGLPVRPAACQSKAVNTLTRTAPAEWAGDNTDAAGVLAALCGVPGLVRKPDALRRAAVLGGGGAARAAIVGLLDQGWQVTVFNRTAERAATLAGELGCAWRSWEERAATDADVILNCTSVGMYPQVDASPMPAEALRPGLVVLDAVYNPPQTRLLREARQRGCVAVSGVEMFLAQAAAQFERWHGRPAPVRIMREALAASVSRR